MSEAGSWAAVRLVSNAESVARTATHSCGLTTSAGTTTTTEQDASLALGAANPSGRFVAAATWKLENAQHVLRQRRGIAESAVGHWLQSSARPASSSAERASRRPRGPSAT